MSYRTLVVDPPWPQKGAGPLKGGHGGSTTSVR